MSASTTAMASSTGKYGAAFWERLWRMSGINFVLFVIIAAAVFGDGADHTRVSISAFVAGMAVLNLLWFAAALRATLADAGQDGWGAAATAASSAVGVMFLLLIALAAVRPVAAGLGEFAWGGFVLSSFPRAMLIMSGSFGLWRARLISNAEFAVGVAFVVLALTGGATWASEGFWAPDGAWSRLVSPILGLVWVLAASGVLLRRSPATRSGW
ncbi:MAG TPA: hypothetical protein VGO61_10840 [Steroidobacteraceae bacterium]|jgi:hypothetical protein|nr:hypothetical protein [Steroidobacteraceae bacterium]